LKSTRTSLNTEVADVAKALHGEKTVFLKAKVSHNFEVHFETIEKLLKDHYLFSDINLMHQQDEGSLSHFRHQLDASRRLYSCCKQNSKVSRLWYF
jgi:hypothetical protein